MCDRIQCAVSMVLTRARARVYVLSGRPWHVGGDDDGWDADWGNDDQSGSRDGKASASRSSRATPSSSAAPAAASNGRSSTSSSATPGSAPRGSGGHVDYFEKKGRDNATRPAYVSAV